MGTKKIKIVGNQIEVKDAFINKWQRSDIAKILKNRLFLLTVLILQILMWKFIQTCMVGNVTL